MRDNIVVGAVLFMVGLVCWGIILILNLAGQINECVSVTGECYKRNQARSNQVIQQVIDAINEHADELHK